MCRTGNTGSVDSSLTPGVPGSFPNRRERTGNTGSLNSSFGEARGGAALCGIESVGGRFDLSSTLTFCVVVSAVGGASVGAVETCAVCRTGNTGSVNSSLTPGVPGSFPNGWERTGNTGSVNSSLTPGVPGSFPNRRERTGNTGSLNSSFGEARGGAALCGIESVGGRFDLSSTLTFCVRPMRSSSASANAALRSSEVGRSRPRANSSAAPPVHLAPPGSLPRRNPNH